MLKKLFYIILLLIGSNVFGQACPILTEPLDGSVDVPVDTPVTWEAVDGVIGYIVSLGTTPGGGEIINKRSSGQNNYYIPEVGLPENTTIHVTIQLFLFGQPVRTCPGESFVTEDVTTPPPCTSLTIPINNEEGVKTSTPVRWNYAPTATGYRLTIGTSDDRGNILSDFDIGNQLFYESADDFPLNEDIFVTVVPYNENGDLGPCTEERFSTSAASIVCEPRFDSTVGGIVSNQPEIDFPSVVAICKDELSNVVTTDDTADGFRWYKINPDGSETLLSQSADLALNEIGNYRYEAYNIIPQAVGSIECDISSNFEVVLSEHPTIIEVLVEKGPETRSLTVLTEGLGTYEYALDNPEGPYQTNNVFNSVVGDRHIVYARDINGCGIAQQEAPRDLSTDNFPRFFTPNSDSVNDTWQFVLSENAKLINVATIYIFDRYGNLLTQMDPKAKGWDGSFRGKPLPSSTYWYRAIALDGDIVQGHFALKR